MKKKRVEEQRNLSWEPKWKEFIFLVVNVLIADITLSVKYLQEKCKQD